MWWTVGDVLIDGEIWLPVTLKAGAFPRSVRFCYLGAITGGLHR